MRKIPNHRPPKAEVTGSNPVGCAINICFCKCVVAVSNRAMWALAPRIGTAGWSIPGRYAGEMPRSGTHLERYAGRLNAVEINSSFYRPHQRKTYERWAQSTPADFRFSVKVPRTITHDARLRDCDALLDRFLTDVAGLGEKLGVLLVQLPPRFSLDRQAAGPFLHGLRQRADTPIALEPRHPSWFAAGVDEWLAGLQVSRVAADPAPVAGAETIGGWNGLAYYRWHGSPQIYYSTYDAGALAALKRDIDEARHGKADVWCIFDNTANAAALGNALDLMEALKPAPL